MPPKEFCDGHIQLCEDIAIIKTTTSNLDKRINGSIDDIKHHIESGSAWRMSIVGLALTLILTVGVQVGAFLYLWGQISKQVEVNTARIYDLEHKK